MCPKIPNIRAALRGFFTHMPRGKTLKKIGFILLGIAFLLYFGASLLTQRLYARYNEQKSVVIQDRNGRELSIRPNIKGEYMRAADALSPEWTNMLVAKEDRYFWYHRGINPLSILRSLVTYFFSGRFEGSSTLTQQLVKTLLGNENERTVANKVVEAVYAMGLEVCASKTEILKMYSDTAYFGNQAEGVAEASKIYFDAIPESLSTVQVLQLLATLNDPSDYPGTRRNEKRTRVLAARVRIPLDVKLIGTPGVPGGEAYERKSADMFELAALGVECPKSCTLTVDRELTDTIRRIVSANLDSPAFASVNNGAVVVMRLDKNAHKNELLAMVGSPHPSGYEKGYQINMAVRPRPIGSTAKPFIYAKAFEKGARPYTEVVDREYRYDIGTGFAFYPKNYDGKYRGVVTLHEALSNSLNVPAVRVLAYAGVENFYSLLNDGLYFEPLQPLKQYDLSIALGGLEMDLFTLANSFTLFPNEGVLKPASVKNGESLKLPMAENYGEHRVIASEFAALVTSILADRKTGVEQFGLVSNLNLPAANYAVKTGTSYDYHDSWTIGYTPDFLVAVWIGNNDNKPMYRLSGSVGAGKIWHEVMETMLDSPYNKETPFNFSRLREFEEASTLEYGIQGDNHDEARQILGSDELILEPHDRDVLEYATDMNVPLVSNDKVSWYANGVLLGEGDRMVWRPATPAKYVIVAETPQGRKQRIRVSINEAR